MSAADQPLGRRPRTAGTCRGRPPCGAASTRRSSSYRPARPPRPAARSPSRYASRGRMTARQHRAAAGRRAHQEQRLRDHALVVHRQRHGATAVVVGDRPTRQRLAVAARRGRPARRPRSGGRYAGRPRSRRGRRRRGHRDPWRWSDRHALADPASVGEQRMDGELAELVAAAAAPVSSTMNDRPAISPPSRRTSSMVPITVPPVASRSSTISTRCPR